MKIEHSDIWLINFDPSIGKEIRKTRPALVVSNDYYNIASGTIFVVPLTSKPPKETLRPFYMEITKDDNNNLSQNSYININQFRNVSKLRFLNKIGSVKKHYINNVMKKILEITNVDPLSFRYFS